MISALLVHRDSLRTDFLFSLRFSTPKTTPPTPTPMTSYSPLNSFQSSIMFKALLSKSTVSSVFLSPLSLNQLDILLSLLCLLIYQARKSSVILLDGTGRRRESTWLFKTTENKGIFKALVRF